MEIGVLKWLKSISERAIRWSSNYHWQDNLNANMLYFIKSLFNRNVYDYSIRLFFWLLSLTKAQNR